MPFYFKKSVKGGPFRFNFSKSGVGLSVGIKGLRVGAGPRGHYINAGRNGFYYRASLNNAGAKTRRPLINRRSGQNFEHENENESSIVMEEIDSGEVMEMQPEELSDLLKEINQKQQQTSLAAAYTFPAVLVSIGLLFVNILAAVIFFVSIFPIRIICNHFDDYKRSTVLMYDLGSDTKNTYKLVTECFDAICVSQKKWHIEASGEIKNLTDWKRNAGASNLIRRKETFLGFRLPSVINSNITPPAMAVGTQLMFFFPDVALIFEGKKVGAVAYNDLRIEVDETNFIETEGVPSDAEVVGNTWKHPNKSGGADRRFNNNYEIPICRYEMMHFTSDSGVNEILEFSKIGNCFSFKQAIKLLASVHQKSAK